MFKNFRMPGPLPHHARGALANVTGRYESERREAFDDGWTADDDLPPLRTETRLEAARSIISFNASPDVPFDRSVNPYRGCEHGCIYCFARPTHAYLGLSPGLDFETRLTAKPNAAEVLRRQLSRPGYQPATIAIGTNTDPYQPIERHYRIMAQVLEVLQRFRHPVSVLTKGALIERDAHILGEMGFEGLAAAGLSLTTLDKALSQRMEPRAALPARRLRAIEVLARAGAIVRVSIGPVIPGLNDHEMEALLTSARDAGATGAGYVTLRLTQEVRALWQAWVAEHYPARMQRITGQVRSLHGGRDYDASFGQRMKGEGPLADLYRARFAAACRRLGLSCGYPRLRTDLFAVPRAPDPQLSLF
jgi:DNA repair photolyase